MKTNLFKRSIRRICRIFQRRRKITIIKHRWLTKVGDQYIWQAHIDRFYQFIWNKMVETYPRDETDYIVEERKHKIFKMWLKEVPWHLKMGNDLERAFKIEVRKYLRKNYNFDPYKHGKEVDDTPTPEQLADWWKL